uniref:Lipase_3 domain-containing protein n=1 Tax=Rhabditophanes sp. KR3021 TaxID=114890 RepID=A0AC35TR23_9BILA
MITTEYIKSVWRGGLKDSFLTLKNTFPNYKIYITGHGLGGAMATLCTATITRAGMVDRKRRICSRFTSFPITDMYRITHAADQIVNLPRIKSLEGFMHHGTEVWYNNDMSINSKYKICAGDDTKWCLEHHDNNEFNFADHLAYFNVNVENFGSSGCEQ